MSRMRIYMLLACLPVDNDSGLSYMDYECVDYFVDEAIESYLLKEL